MKKHNNHYWRLKCRELVKKQTRERGFCERCGKQGGLLHGSHIISCKYQNTDADPDNLLALCPTCHWWWHQEPAETRPWLESKWPGRYDRLKAKRNAILKIDFSEYYIKLCSTLKKPPTID